MSSERAHPAVSLVPIASVDPTALRWIRVGDHPAEFALLAGDARVVTLRWSTGRGSLATAETAGGTWTLKRGGFLNPHATVRAQGGRGDLARLTVHLSYHRIEVAGGPAYRFHRAGLLVPAWNVTSDDGTEVVHFEPVREGRALSAGAVITSPAGAKRPELLLLMVLGWYFIVLAWFEDEALVSLSGQAGPARRAPASPSGEATSP